MVLQPITARGRPLLHQVQGHGPGQGGGGGSGGSAPKGEGGRG